MRLGAESDGCGKRLTGQHVCAVQLPVDDPVQQHLPIGLRLQGDEEALILEIAVLIGDRQRGHIGQLDKTEL